MIGILIGFVISVGIITIRYLFDGTVKTGSELSWIINGNTPHALTDSQKQNTSDILVHDSETSVDLFVEGKIDAMLMVPSIRIKDILKRIPEDFSYEISESNIVNLKGNFVRYNIVRSYVKDLYTNKMNILDFERTYIDKRLK